MGNVLLLVEGQQDFYAIREFAAQLGIGSVALSSDAESAPDFVVRAVGGFDTLRKNLLLNLRQSEIEVFGVIVDADRDFAGRWDSIRNRLFEDAPADWAHPSVPGTIFPTASGRWGGVWVWPDNHSEGDLEAFAMGLVRTGDPLLSFAEKVVGELPEKRFGANKKNKAILCSWLAWQKDPGESVGAAIRNRTLDASSPAGQSFADWLKELKEKAESIDGKE